MSKSRTTAINQKNTDSLFNPKTLKRLGLVDKGQPKRNFLTSNPPFRVQRPKTNERKHRKKRKLADMFRDIRKKMRVHAPLTKANGRGQIYINKSIKNRDIRKEEILSDELESRYQKLLRSKYKIIKTNDLIKEDIDSEKNRALTTRAQSCVPIIQKIKHEETLKIKNRQRREAAKKHKQNLSQPPVPEEIACSDLDYENSSL